MKDMERHLETCQRFVIHTSQNAQAPKIIDFTTLNTDGQQSAKNIN